MAPGVVVVATLGKLGRVIGRGTEERKCALVTYFQLDLF